MSKPTLSLTHRVEDWKRRTLITPEGCWRYLGARDFDGYGCVKFNSRMQHLNRVSAHLFLGLDLSDVKLHALHKSCCPHKDCWNPDHLYVGTNQENVIDSLVKRNLKCELDRHDPKRDRSC